MHEYELQLEKIVGGTPWLVAALEAVRDIGPSGAYIAAGALRDVVWNWLTHRSVSEPTGDVDVVYFNPNEPTGSAAQYESALTLRLGSLRWELTNQALVHRWYDDARVAPYRSLAEGISTWPETATAVAIRLGLDPRLDVIAPLGLEDLFELVVRHNPVRATATIYENRVAAKKWASRWPELRILPADRPPNISRSCASC